MPKKKQCLVTVGNIGTVTSDVGITEAKKVFKEYVKDSKKGQGRAGNEPVTLMCDGFIIDEYLPESDIIDDSED